MTAPTMTPSEHAERTPDAPAIIMGASAETAMFARLEERSGGGGRQRPCHTGARFST
jgi:hypothetical protein